MSYYDFDEHFWSPSEVCCQKTLEVLPNKPSGRLTQWVCSMASAVKGFVVHA